MAKRPDLVIYDDVIESAIARIEAMLQGSYGISGRSVAVLLLEEDKEIEELVRKKEGARFWNIRKVVAEAKAAYDAPLSYVISLSRQSSANSLTSGAIVEPTRQASSFGDQLSQLMMNPITGFPILIAVLVLLYEFVGSFGAGTLVDFIETTVFGEFINPVTERLIAGLIPYPVVQELFVGEYGIVTLGVRYAVAIILPIVGTFFIAFSVIEDSGYLPRLAMLVDKGFKVLGLNGRAVIPMTLGFGCDTMATMVTRTLETPRERLISTFLLALAIPCSAQLGVIMALLSGTGVLPLLIWALIVFLTLILVGFLTAQILPGERPSFYMEVPPLRLPVLSNVLMKTWVRMKWYFMEVFPLFIAASIIIWLGKITGLFDLAISAIAPVVASLGLPRETAVAFLFGFFRRDYGAAGLYDLRNLMTVRELVVASVTLTLFVPCIAQFSMMLKERGWRSTLGVVAFIFPFAFLVGYILNKLLSFLGL